MFGKKRRLREQWLAWSSDLHEMQTAESSVQKIVDGTGRLVHTFDFPVLFCLDPSHAETGESEVPVHANVSIDGVQLLTVSNEGGQPRQVTVMEWLFEQYTPTVSDDGTEVRFRSRNPADPGNAVYIREAVPRGVLGDRVDLAVMVRKGGAEPVLAMLRDKITAHMASEPDRSAMSKNELRVRTGGTRP